jgi:SAM-dependent methyltransferase
MSLALSDPVPIEPAPDFDRLARVYRWMEWLSFGPALARSRRFFLSELGECRHALVLGDGDGRFTAHLLAHNPVIRVEAVDASPAMLSELRRRAGPHRRRVETHLADLRAWTPSGSNYDLVVTHFFLDCLSTDEATHLARRAHSCMAPNGAWLVSEFNEPAGWFGRMVAGPLISFLYRGFGLLTGLEIRRLPDHRKALSEAGFALIRRHSWLGGLLVSELWQRRSRSRQG